MRRTLMYVGRTGHRLQSRLLQLLEQPEISTVAFVSIKLDELIWVMSRLRGLVHEFFDYTRKYWDFMVLTSVLKSKQLRPAFKKQLRMQSVF